MLEFGFFQEGTSGHVLGTGEAIDSFRRVTTFFPFVEIEAHEIIPYETGKEVMREFYKAQAEAMKR